MAGKSGLSVSATRDRGSGNDYAGAACRQCLRDLHAAPRRGSDEGRKNKGGTDYSVCRGRNVFYERGAPEELLLDNDTAFRSRLFTEFATTWGVRLRYRCAHAPSGNGITERCHRTVKVIAARKRCSIPEAVYLYNVTPRDDCTASSAPAAKMYKYTVKVRGIDRCAEDDQSENAVYAIGDRVWVKPPGSRCDTMYQPGYVTGVISHQAVEVDGIVRHIRDLRHRTPTAEPSASGPQTNNEDGNMITVVPRQIVTRTTIPNGNQQNTTSAPRRSARIRQGARV
uniref:Integrase catalytic domain-containing protein n=1 Tax=Trichuris muris TaxID=70415 RepID=A0A5S6Q596_TRIMR